jgi:serine/threonine protein kinase
MPAGSLPPEFTGDYTPHPDHQPATAPPLVSEALGTRIGPYKLLQLLGQGGMGSVYVAEQSEPVKRRVALKVIKPGMDSAQVLRRFEAERQALALMDHTNIARVFEAGTADSGRPYFVMELVQGIPITRYCDELHLTVRQRLELFGSVCQAIQHAHQKGIIHRDIKPSNVLVCMQDGKPVPKVIDFGLAKALHQPLTEATMYTEVGAVVGTLEYMSPEQAEMSPLGVDTRTDVYALGVLLYELLTGTTPLDRKRLRSAGLVERVRIIKEEEPPRPSTRLSQSKQTLADLATRRRTEPGRLRREVSGELDWIVMKCLEKDRTNRYESAGALARDVERYLHDEQVEACPPGRRYRLGKFLRRNRTWVTAAVLVLAALLAGVGGTTWGWVRAERERDDKSRALEAEKLARARTREALDEMSSRVIEDWLSRQPYHSAEQKAFLEKTAKFYEEFAAETGDDDATLAGVADAHRRLATISFTLGRHREAAGSAEQAARLWRQLGQRHPAEARYRIGLVRALSEQARAMHNDRKTEDIDPVELEAITAAELLAAAAPTDADLMALLAQSLINRGQHLTYKARPAEALAVLERAMPLQQRLVAADPTDDRRQEGLARIRNYRMDSLYALYREEEADRERIAALEIHEGIARRSPALAGARRAVGNMRLNTAVRHGVHGRFTEAAAEFRKAEQWYGPLAEEYPGVENYRGGLAVIYSCWARALAMAGDWPAAAQMATRAITNRRELGRLNEAAAALTTLADCQVEAGQFDDALRDYDTAIGWLTQNLASKGPLPWTKQDLAAAYAGRAQVLDRMQRHEVALASWDKAIEYAPAGRQSADLLWPRTGFPVADATHFASSPCNLLAGKADTLSRLGRLADAEKSLRRCLALCEQAAPDAWATFHTRARLGAALAAQMNYADAEPLLKEGYAGMKSRQAKAPADCRAALVTALQQLVQLYDAWSKPDEAAKWRQELATMKPR